MLVAIKRLLLGMAVARAEPPLPYDLPSHPPPAHLLPGKLPESSAMEKHGQGLAPKGFSQLQSNS